MLKFRQRLAWLLDRRRISRTKLAELSGVSRQYINNLLHGFKTNPSPEKLRAIAGALGTTIAFLFAETDDPNPWNAEKQVPKALQEYLTECDALQDAVQRMTVEERVTLIVHFIRARFPQRFPFLELAFQLSMTVRGLNDVLAGECEVTSHTLRALVKITGVETRFFATGHLAAVKDDDSSSLGLYRERPIQEI